MAEVTIQDLGSLGELIAAIATIATLGYLALQIRRNTRTAQTSTYQSTLESSNRVQELILAHPHLERIYRIGRKDFSQLTEEERPQFRLLIDLFLNVFESMCLQHERGTLDEDFWQARLDGLRGLLTQPGIRSMMISRGAGGRYAGRVAAFSQLIESCLDETQPGP